MNDWIYKKHFKTRSECSAYWHDKSIHLNKSSEILWKAWNDNKICDSGDTYRMLIGMSFELLFKAFYVANGKTPPKTHKLNELYSESGIAFSEKEKKLLDILSGYVIWEGKYPTPNDTKKKPGYNSIKHQWGAYRSSSRPDYSPFDKKVVHLNDIESSDFGYNNLQKTWAKVNSQYVKQFIST